MTIKFNGIYGALDNDYPCLVLMEGQHYPSVTHAWEASKLPKEERAAIADKSIQQVRKLAKTLKIRDGWYTSNLDTLEELLRQKFENIRHSTALLQSYPHDLIYDNDSDDFLGRVNGKGLNQLGFLLMKIRENLSNRMMVAMISEGWKPEEVRAMSPSSMLKTLIHVRKVQLAMSKTQKKEEQNESLGTIKTA